MKILVPKQQLLDAVLLAERVTGKKESLPVLSCILFDAQKELIVRATNLEAGIEIKIPCEVEEKGIIAVPAGILSQTLRSISGDKVSFKTEESNLLVESKGTKTLIKAIAHEEFPILSEGVGGKMGTTVSREKLLKGIQSVSYAASPSMIRPELGSIYVSLKSQAMVCVATDSFRLAEKTIPGTAGKDTGDILIPLKHVNELAYILERIPSDQVQVGVEDFQLTISNEGVRYVSRVVDANFPDYKTIIPKKATTEAILLKSDLTDMLRKARVFSGNDQHVGLHIYPKKKIFTATARSAEVGEMSDNMEAAVSGEDLDINFHVSYIAESLSSIESDSVTMSFAGAGKPLVMRGVGDASFMYLVMPLNR
jgi:DNA polymerase III subunit beta